MFPCVLTSLCDAPALPSNASVPQEPPLPLHPHLALQVMLLRDLRGQGETDFLVNIWKDIKVHKYIRSRRS